MLGLRSRRLRGAETRTLSANVEEPRALSLPGLLLFPMLWPWSEFGHNDLRNVETRIIHQIFSIILLYFSTDFFAFYNSNFLFSANIFCTLTKEPPAEDSGGHSCSCWCYTDSLVLPFPLKVDFLTIHGPRITGEGCCSAVWAPKSERRERKKGTEKVVDMGWG